jgi:hypothetical protein
VKDDDARDYEFIPNQRVGEYEQLARRCEFALTDIDQRLKDIVLLLGQMRADLRTERDRTDQLERDIVDHRNHIDELASRRRKKI